MELNLEGWEEVKVNTSEVHLNFSQEIHWTFELD